MKKFLSLYIIATVFVLASCQKEYSTEGAGDTSNIIGADCRINKITYADSASGVGIGSISALINAADVVTDVTKFDSLTSTIDFNSLPQYFTDTVAIDADQYFTVDLTSKRVKLFHGLIDPTVPGSPEFDVTYTYDGAGHLVQKSYYFSLLPAVPFLQATYTYTNGNLSGMQLQDMFTNDLVEDASISYYTNIAPKNYMYIFPDETTYAEFNQFFNFGTKSTNAIKDLKVRYFDPGNIVVDSSVSGFKNYIMSRDNYVTSVLMTGDDQPSIPAAQSKLSFYYKCK
jgi:hypothetical protein